MSRRPTPAVRGTDGVPLAPLRTLREQPGLIDDQAAARLIGPDVLPPEDARWARAWLVCSQATLVASPRYGVDPTSELRFDPRTVPAPRGLSTVARREQVLGALVRAGVLLPAQDEGASILRLRPVTGGLSTDTGATTLPSEVTWSAAVCMRHPAAVALDWPGLVSACGREPAPLLVVRALAEYLLPLDAWAMVPRRDLTERTGYLQKQVRVALRRLAAAGLIEIEGESGRVARYRFTPGALGRSWPAHPDSAGAPQAESTRPVDRAAEPAPVRGSTPAPEQPGPQQGTSNLHKLSSSSGATSPDGRGLEMVVGGVSVRVAPGATLDIGEGAHARLEVGPDGRVRLSVSS